MLSKLADQQEEASGFSLVELMVAVAIVAVLAAVVVPGYSNHMMRSRQSAAIGELMSIKGSQERYFADHGGYAGRINLLDKYSGGAIYTNGDYQYWITANTSILVTSGTISVHARGDLNRDGVFNDRWQLSIDNLDAKPQHDESGTNEGFSWSSLGKLFK